MRTLLLLAVLASAPALADGPTEAQRWAIQTGQVAGHARFCKLDSDHLEQFLERAYARMAESARDDTDDAVARVIFRNTADMSAARGPAKGCAPFNAEFDALFQSLKPMTQDEEAEKPAA